MPDGRLAVIFDLDGTLIDSALDLHAAMNRLLARHRRPPIDIATGRRLIGDGTRRFIERAMEETGAPVDGATLDALVPEFLAFYEADVATLTRPYPGVPETLAALRAAGLRLAVCTNKPQRAAELVLDALGLAPFIETTAGGDALPWRKPDPRHLTALLDRLGVAPAQAVMVGDNEHDAAAAHGAGLPFVLMTYGYARTALDEIAADRRLADFAALPAAIQSLP